MSSLVAFFLGIVTIIIIFVPFWYLATVSSKVKPIYAEIFCNNISTAGVSNVQ